MKISVFFDHILQAAEQSGESVADLLKYVKSCGIDAVEINLTYLVQTPETMNLLMEADLEISCIYEFYQMEKTGVFHKLRQQKRARKHVKTALKAGAKRILVVPGFLPEKEAKEMLTHKDSYEELESFFEANDNMKRIVEGLVYITQYGRKESAKQLHREAVTVTIEDFDDWKSPLCSMNGVKYTLDKVPGLAHTFDTGNYAYINEDVEKAWELLHESIAHVHCKDRGNDGRGNRLLSVATGTGYLPIGLLVQNLEIEKYEGYLAIEHFDVPNQKAAIKRSADYLKNV